jgi:hypothetical protein
MDALAQCQHHSRVRVLPHIKRLDDCFGDFLVRVVCECGACREIEPEALARLVGWKMTLKELALRMRCSRTIAAKLCTRLPPGSSAAPEVHRALRKYGRPDE